MKLRDLLQLCRISNLPTVWSNAVVGVFAASYVTAEGKDHPAGWPNAFSYLFLFACSMIVAIAMSLIYSGGMAMNDVVDRKIDAKERPSRPIPSGRISVKQGYILTSILFGWGLGIIILADTFAIREAPLFASIAALLTILCAVAYNLCHANTSVSIFLMALCRCGIVLCGAMLISPAIISELTTTAFFYVFGPAVLLVLYTLAISIVARREMQAKRFAGPKTVMNMIAAMPLLDALWLLVMGLWPASLFCVACAGLTKLAHRKVAGS